jgi:hypothetical protein
MAPKEIPLKRKNKNNPQIKSYTDAIKRGQKIFTFSQRKVLGK